MNKVKPHPKYRNIIFDLGAVLINWDPEAIIKDIFKHEPNPPLHFIEATKTREWLEFDRGTLTHEGLANALASRFDKNQMLHFLNNHSHYLTPLEQGLDIFKQIQKKGYDIYILSNMGNANFEKLYKENSFFKEVKGMIISAHVNAVKPEPEIYQKLLETYALKADECLFIDDLEANIKAGQQLGVDGIMCKNHAQVLQELKTMNVLL